MMLPLAKPLQTAGYALLFFDARSHGRSDGDTFASLPRFAEDLEQAVDWLQAQGEIDASRVGVCCRRSCAPDQHARHPEDSVSPEG